MTYPIKPTGDDIVSETYMFAENNILKTPMTQAELLEGYSNKGESDTELTSIPDAKKFNSFWNQIHKTVVWLISYAQELYTSKLEKSGGTMTGNLVMSSNKVTGLANGENSSDAVNKSQLDNLSNAIANLTPDTVLLGSINSNFTLVKDKVHTGNIISSCTLSLPTLSSSSKFVNCMFEFTIVNGITLTLPSNVKWNYGIIPSFNNATKNRLMFDTSDGGATWSAFYAQIGP